MSHWRADHLADWRAWLPQFWSDPFPATVAETAALARDRGPWWRARRGAASGAGALPAVLARLDLAALADVDVRRLSGGERQRVALATALLQGAPLLLLDEPTSHLDLAHQQLLLAVLVEHADRGGAVVASGHDIDLAWQLATHAVLLGAGAAVAGPRDAVITAEALSAVFGVEIECSALRDRLHFAVAPLRGRVG